MFMARYASCPYRPLYRGPASLLEITKITGHGKTSDHDVSRTIGVLMKSAQSGTFSANNAIGLTVGKPRVAIKAQQI